MLLITTGIYFWKLETQEQSASMVRFWWGPTSWFIAGTFSLCSCTVEATRDVSGVSDKGTNPIHEGSTLMIKAPPQSPTSLYSTIIWGFEDFNIWILGRQKHSDHSSYITYMILCNYKIETYFPTRMILATYGLVNAIPWTNNSCF